MDAYVYMAALYCSDCARKIQRELEDEGETIHTGDSGDWPQGPYRDGGGESDSPQHCDECGYFLRNPLTPEGREYVKQAWIESLDRDPEDNKVVYEWVQWYGIEVVFVGDVLNHYLVTALWSSPDPDTMECLDSKYSTSDLTKASRAKAREDVAAFIKAAVEFEGFVELDDTDIGHDFWLTRNGHGARFWDGDYPEPLATHLTKLSESFGECHVWPAGRHLHLEG
jgi:hypothetical protein